MQIKPPAHFDAIAKSEWNRIIELLQSRGLFDELRMASIEGYCIAYARFIDAEKKVAKETDPAAIDRLLAISGTAQRKMRDHARDLGLHIQVQARGPKVAPAQAETHEQRMCRELNEVFAKMPIQ